MAPFGLFLFDDYSFLGAICSWFNKKLIFTVLMSMVIVVVWHGADRFLVLG